MQSRAKTIQFRKPAKAHLEESWLNKSTIVTARLGDRSQQTSDPKGGYAVGDRVVIQVYLGDNNFDPWIGVAIVKDVQVMPFKFLQTRHLVNPFPDQATPGAVSRKFADMYGQAPGPEDTITLLTFKLIEYRD